MMKSVARILGTLIEAFMLVSLLGEPVAAQTLGERVGAQFPHLTVNARSASLADATVALIDDFSGYWSNPSILGFVRKSSVDYSARRVSKGITLEHLGFVHDVAMTGVFAASFDILHFGGFGSYTNGQIRERGYETRMRISYGRLMTDRLAAGVTLQAYNSTTDMESVWGFSGDIGLAYAPGRYLRYGVSLRGLGSYYNVKAPIVETDVEDKRLPKSLSAGMVLDFPFAEYTQRVVILMENEKIIGEPLLLYRLGVEYQPASLLALRIGLVFREPEIESRTGIGVVLSKFSVDYAYRYSRRGGPSHFLTIIYSWP